MAYATVADLIQRYGPDILAPAGGRDEDAVIDEAAVTAALTDASSEIDLHLLAAGLSPPQASPAAWLVLTCCELAVSRLPETVAASPERTKARYDQAIARLKLLADLDADTPLTDGGSGGGDAPVIAAPPAPVLFGSAPKLFSRRSDR